MQKVLLEGRLGRDASLREAKTGRKFVSLTLATNLTVAGVEKTYWWDVMWFNYNDGIIPHLKKGSIVHVGGDIDPDLETGDDGVTRCRRKVMADFIQFGTSSQKQQDGEQQTQVTTPKQEQAPEVEAQPVVTKCTVKETTQAVPQQEDENDLPF